MRDIGLFVWVVLLIVGVVGSMTSSIRRQREQAARRDGGSAPPPDSRGAPQPLAGVPPGTSAQQATLVHAMQEITARQGIPPPAPRPRRPASRPAPAVPAAPAPQPAPHSVAPPRPAKQLGLFGSGPELVRAVIAAEVLGKPRALRDEY